MIAGLDHPTTGTVRAGERVLNDLLLRERDLSFVFQTYALYPHRTAYDNIAFPLEVAGVPRAEIDRRVQETAELLGLGKLLSRRPKQLSGGERQRVALGRAIVRQPRFFLFDEPLSNLDAPLRASMRRELKRLHGRLGTTFIYVTHDQDEALSLSDRVAVLRGGRILQVASPTRIYDQPANTFVGSFFGSPAMNVVHGSLAKAGSAIQIGTWRVPLDGAIAEESARGVLIGIRPEHVRLRSDPTTGWLGTVTFAETHGSVTHVEVALDDTAARGPGARRLRFSSRRPCCRQRRGEAPARVRRSWRPTDVGAGVHREVTEQPHVVIVGGGFGGLAAARALGDALANDFRAVDPRAARILLVEAAPTILTSFPRGLRLAAERSLQRLGVETRVNPPPCAP